MSLHASFVDAKLAHANSERCIASGDTLILNAAHNATHVASKVYTAEPAVEGALATGEWLIIRPKQQALVPAFLSNWVKAPMTRHRLQLLVKGIHLYPKDVARLEIALPHLSEQHRIAAILDQANALRAKRRAALAQLDAMAEAVFKDMFVSAADWPETTVGDLARSIRTGPFGSQLLHSEFVAEGVAVLGIDNAVKNEFAWGERRFVTKDKYKELARYRVYPRDIIVTIMGTCGRAAIVPNDIPLAITTKHLCSITLDEAQCLPEYLHACLLQHPAVLRQLGVTARGAVMPGLNMGLIKETRIPLPPIGLQEDFAKLQSQFGRLRDAFARSKDASDTLFASLQHRAFRGEL